MLDAAYALYMLLYLAIDVAIITFLIYITPSVVNSIGDGITEMLTKMKLTPQSYNEFPLSELFPNKRRAKHRRAKGVQDEMLTEIVLKFRGKRLDIRSHRMVTT